jgi:transcriptional regulator with XRE-family HTH domain
MLLVMSTRTRPEYEAARLGRQLLADVGRELRMARHMAGMRQADVARRMGSSTSHVCRIEHGQVPSLGLPALTRHAAVVGLRPSIRLYPLGRRLVDRPQLELLGRLRGRVHPAWGWRTEVPMPMANDLRSADACLRIVGCTVLVEAFTRLSDFQAQSAAAARKKRDLPADRLILLVAATRANRHALAEAESVAWGSFPVSPRRALRALAEGRDPQGDAIVLL